MSASASAKNDAAENEIIDTESSVENNDNVVSFSKSSSGLREQYLKEKLDIESEHGTLEDMREKLGMSRRKICQLLLVDPSAWTRWTKSKEGAPPHVYQALRWYMELNQQGGGAQKISAQPLLKEAQQEIIEDNQHMPMVLEAKMLQISTVYERQLSKISQEIENLKSVLVVKDDIAQTVKNTVSDAIAVQMAQHLSKLQVPAAQPTQVVIQPDPRAESLKYENARYMAQIQSLETSIRQIRQDVENYKTPKKKKETTYEVDGENSSAQVANKFMATTLFILFLGAILYAFIQYA